MVQYEKVQPNRRIDIFDADVFATVRMLEDMGKTDTEGGLIHEQTKQTGAPEPDAPKVQRRSAAVAICPDDSWRVLIADGYRPLSQCPEVMMCVNVYAELIASMTIHLMENGEHGDVRVKDELTAWWISRRTR